ncbi:hypothetical protein JW877_02675 [bacterium]|nr:hypothetical protein [bacterium]
MARKKRTFADKVAKGTGPRHAICPVCGGGIQIIKVVKPYLVDDEKKTYRYREEITKVCKCNEKEVF